MAKGVASKPSRFNLQHAQVLIATADWLLVSSFATRMYTSYLHPTFFIIPLSFISHHRTLAVHTYSRSLPSLPPPMSSSPDTLLAVLMHRRLPLDPYPLACLYTTPPPFIPSRRHRHVLGRTVSVVTLNTLPPFPFVFILHNVYRGHSFFQRLCVFRVVIRVVGSMVDVLIPNIVELHLYVLVTSLATLYQVYQTPVCLS